MASLTNSNTCIGLTVEGDLLKLATITKVGKKIKILDLATMPVQTHKFANVADQEEGSSDSQMGFELESTDDSINYQAVRDFLQSHYNRRSSVAVSYGEPTIRTLILSRDPKEKKSKMLSQLLGEIQHVHNVELTKDMVDWVPLGDTSALSLARLEVAPLLDVFATPAGTERRPMRINFVTSNDIAILNMVRVHFRFNAQEVSHVIYVNNDETKLYIMRGNDIVHIAPVIMQGSRDRDVASLLLTRIELAADSAGYPTPAHIVLGGHAERIGLRELLNQMHPDAILHSLTRLRATAPSVEMENEMTDYLLPISAAWQKLDVKNPHFYRMNVIPVRLREDQNKFKLAWHGFILLLLLFAATVGLTMKGLEQHAKVGELKESLAFEKQQITEQQEIVARINALEARSADVIKATTTLDTLLSGAEKWSMTLDTIANSVAILKSLWISEMKPTETGVNITGFSLNRKNVPNLATLSGGALINEVSVQEIGSGKSKVKVLRYVMDLPVPALAPYSFSRATEWHRNLKIPNMDVSTQSSAPSTTPASAPKGGS